MLIVAGHLKVAPETRDSYVANCAAVVDQARSAEGCLDFAITADPLDPSRVNVYERWESRAAVEAFRDGGPDDDQAAAILTGEVSEYEVTNRNALFGAADRNG